jgi:glycosyltransferase involved in cell wall biosynthesis
MQRGGIEMWLLHVLHHIDRRRFQMDFLVPTSDACDYDDEMKALGARIFPCLQSRPPSRDTGFYRSTSKGSHGGWPERASEYALHYAGFFRRCLREHGPYDVVHAHMFHFNGFVMRLAAKAGVEIRIAHSHEDLRGVDSRASLLRRIYLMLMKRWLDRYATKRLACSHHAGEALFNRGGKDRPPWQAFYCGVDLEPFRKPVEPAAVRAELGIPEGTRVIGHVGKFHEQKNHRFLIEIMVEVARRDPQVYLLLVGDGPLRAEIEKDVARRSLQDRVVFAGIRTDVPRLMLGAMDAFVFPSRYEGLPLTGIEAQAAGIPCLFSDAITPEVEIVPGLVRRLSIAEPAEWAKAIGIAFQSPCEVRREEALAIVQRSPFNAMNGIRALEEVYEGMHSNELIKC